MGLTKTQSGGLEDQSVTLDKLPHGTSSNDGKFLRANNGADPSFESISGGTTINNNADNRVITGSGTANTLNGESSVVIDANGKLGIGTSSPTLSSSAYQGLHIHQTASGGAKGSQIHLTNDYGGSAAGDGSHISHYNNYLYINNQENGSTYFYNNGSPTATILANGNFGVGTQAPLKKLDVNGDIKASSIYFGSTNDSNKLDGYEEGTYTPTFSSSGATFAYNHQYGYYQKVGDHVHVTFYITLSGTNSSGLSGNSIVINLPFTTTGSTRFEAGVAFAMIYKIDLIGFGNPLGKVYQGNSFINVLYADDNNTGGAYGSDRFDESGAGISGSVTYKV